MKAIAPNAGQLYETGRRLDASYHASDGVKALHFIRQWASEPQQPVTPVGKMLRDSSKEYSAQRVESLAEVADIFNGPRFARDYVTDPAQGVPFLSSSDMLQADLGGVKLLSRSRTPNALLDAIRLRRGWTLISCSGTIGNTVYVRSDMDGMTASQHVMRAAPKDNAIPSGYLYAFLSSGVGYALVTQGTYGAVVQHIEPHHIANLPIPRLDPCIEQRIHELVEQAAALRAEANENLRIINADVTHSLGLPTSFLAQYDHARATGCGSSYTPNLRLDAYYHVGYAGQAANTIQKIGCPLRKLSDVAVEVFNPPIFKRIYVGSDGMPYFMGYEVYETHPQPSRYLARSTKDLERYILREGMIIVQDAGQRYGLLGTPIYANRTLDGKAATNNMIRIVSPDKYTAGYLFAFLNTEIGRRLIVRESYGSSLPHILPAWLATIPIPWPQEDVRRRFGKRVIDAFDQRADANDLEETAQSILAVALPFNL